MKRKESYCRLRSKLSLLITAKTPAMTTRICTSPLSEMKQTDPFTFIWQRMPGTISDLPKEAES